MAESYRKRDEHFERIYDIAKQEARAALARMPLRRRSVCRTQPLFTNGTKGEVMHNTWNRPFRYFSIFDCGKDICVAYKDGSTGALVFTGVSPDGLDLISATGVGDLDHLFEDPERDADPLLEDLRTNHRSFSHNYAVVALGEGQYAMVGGMGLPPGGKAGYGRRDRPPLQGTGIRFTRGVAWPWSRKNWTMPKLVISESTPQGCIDRRPGLIARLLPVVNRWQNEAGGLPEHGCEVDGLLSLVFTGRSFRLYSRANLFENALAGGRFVQTSESHDGFANWTAWEPVRIGSLPAGQADLYTLHVQRNPAHSESLIALFPLSHPPQACIGLAFSRNGVDFSSPINLRAASLGWRTADRDGTGLLEWRAEDHPAAGAVLRKGEVWFYLHLSVKGMSMEHSENHMPRVERFRLPRERLLSLTHQGLRALTSSKGHRSLRRRARRRARSFS